MSHLGIETKPFYLESDDTFKAGLPLANFKFAVSYGDPQTVRVLALRDVGKVDLKYRINGGKEKSQETDGVQRWRALRREDRRVLPRRPESREGRQGGRHRRGVVRGGPLERPQKWWRNAAHHGTRRSKSPSFTYTVPSTTQNRVLVVAAEDYTGASPVQTTGPHYLSTTWTRWPRTATADVYDVDANGRTAPDDLGVLSHYRAVIWYTGDDTVTREPGWGAGNASRLAMDEMLNMREYMNEGGRVLFTGKNAGAQFTPTLGTQFYDPTAANGSARRPRGDRPLPRDVRLGRRAERRAGVLVRRVPRELRAGLMTTATSWRSTG